MNLNLASCVLCAAWLLCAWAYTAHSRRVTARCSHRREAATNVTCSVRPVAWIGSGWPRGYARDPRESCPAQSVEAGSLSVQRALRTMFSTLRVRLQLQELSLIQRAGGNAR